MHVSKFIFIFTVFFIPIASGQNSFLQGEKYFNAGSYLKARSFFRSHLQSSPKDVDAWNYLGETEAHLRNWKASASCFEKLCVIERTTADHHYKYGAALAMSAKESNKLKALTMIGTIRKSFETAIALNPSHIDSRWALIELNLELPSIFGGSVKDAATYADQLLKISPVDGWLAKGRIHEKSGRFPDAEQCYINAVRIGGSKTTYKKLADLYQNKMKQPERAKATWTAYNEKQKI